MLGKIKLKKPKVGDILYYGSLSIQGDPPSMVEVREVGILVKIYPVILGGTSNPSCEDEYEIRWFKQNGIEQHNDALHTSWESEETIIFTTERFSSYVTYAKSTTTVLLNVWVAA